jgi:2,4-dienoyl-CoA reductase-like NADH-dependent reductase (Old Yellow Enzyme family)
VRHSHCREKTTILVPWAARRRTEVGTGHEHADGGAGSNAVAPSPIPNLNGEVHKELGLDDIKEIVAVYGAATAVCRAGSGPRRMTL